VQERGLAEALARPLLAELRLGGAGAPFAAHDLHAAALDDVEGIAALALRDDRIAGPVVRDGERLRAARLELGQGPREAQIERPVEPDAHPADEARQLRPVDGAPQHPRDDARELHPEHLRDAAVVADDRELAEALELERLRRAAADRREDVARQRASLADRVLRG